MDYVTICANCFERWEQSDYTVWQLDKYDCCEDIKCEVYLTNKGPQD